MRRYDNTNHKHITFTLNAWVTKECKRTKEDAYLDDSKEETREDDDLNWTGSSFTLHLFHAKCQEETSYSSLQQENIS